MCGGGGGGDGGAAAREEKRQREQDSIISDVDRLFGVHTDAPEYAKPNKDDYWVHRGKSSGAGSNRGGQQSRGNHFDEDAYNRAMAEWQGGNASNKAAAAANAEKRQQLYDETAADVREHFLTDLNKQQDNSRRVDNFSLARRGVKGGSSELDHDGRFLEAYNRSVLDIGNRADSTINNLKQADENARLRMHELVRSGETSNSVIQSALTGMSNAADNARTNAMTGGLGDVFGGATQIWLNDQQNQGNLNAYSRFNNRSSGARPFNGTVN